MRNIRTLFYFVLVTSISQEVIADKWSSSRARNFESKEKKAPTKHKGFTSFFKGAKSKSKEAPKKTRPQNSMFFNRFWGKKEEKDKAVVSKDVSYFDQQRQIRRKLTTLWDLTTQFPVAGQVWLGMSYKDVPYTPQEFEDVKERIIQKELESYRQEYIRKKKLAASAADESSEEVDDYIDSFIDSEDEEKKEDKKEAEKKWLEGFDEADARKKVLTRTTFPKSRLIETDAIYFQLSNKDLYCVELETGITVWVIRLQSKILATPFETKTTLHFVADGYLYSIDKEAGVLLSRSYLNESILATPYVKGDSYFLANYRRRVISWSVHRNFPKWRRLVSGDITSGVYGNDENLFVAMENGEFSALNFDGEIKWTFVNKGIEEERLFLEREVRNKLEEIAKERKEAKDEERSENKTQIIKLEKEKKLLEIEIELLKTRVRGRFLSAPLINDEAIYIGSTDYNLYKLDKYTFSPIWQYTCISKILETAHVGKEIVWQLDKSGFLHSIDVKSGNKNQIIPGVKRVVHALDKSVFYVDQNGKLINRQGEVIVEINGMEGMSYRVSQDKKIIFAYHPSSVKVVAYDLSKLLR